MSIRKTVQELRGMAENLEASGFDNGQAQSTIEAIAVSIERFAVTPEGFLPANSPSRTRKSTADSPSRTRR